MNKRHILYIGNDFSSTSNYTTTQDLLSQKLRQEGFEVQTISKYKNYILRLLDIFFSILSMRKVDYILIDVFSTNYFYLVRFATWIARSLNKKYITILHGGDLPKRLDRSERSSKKVFHNALFNVSPSGYLKYEFEKRGYNTLLIPNSIEISKYTYDPSAAISPKILWVRSFRHLYNPLMAIEVIHRLKKKYSDVKLCMIGPIKDDSHDLVIKKIREYGLENQVEITGALKKEDWIKKSKDYSFFINTTNVDNTPVSVIEAMALGKLIISTNVGGIPYLLDDTKTAYLVDQNDSEKMAEIIDKELNNRSNSVHLNAREQAEKFDWEHVRNDWLKILL